jgi:hypothetical protein
MGSLLKILSFLATLFTFIRERQLINRGKEEERANVDKTDTKTGEEMAEAIKDIRSLSDTELDDRLYK